MKQTTRILTVTLLALAPAAARAGSIYAKAKANVQTLTSDDTARKVGDTVSILIAERSVIENQTKRDMKKDTLRSAKTGGTLDLANLTGPVGHHVFDLPRLDLTSQSQTKFDGSANYDSDRSVLDTVTVTVQDVLPNGNLVVVGQRTREIDGDRQIINVSGIIRPSDIAFNNTVGSDKVADFRIVYHGKGPEGHFTKPGWLGRFLNRINPF